MLFCPGSVLDLIWKDGIFEGRNSDVKISFLHLNSAKFLLVNNSEKIGPLLYIVTNSKNGSGTLVSKFSSLAAD